MICRNCQTEVDDDLIFCTNCGERLFESPGEASTVLLNDQAPAANDAPATRETVVQKPPKSSSRLKWAALIVALVAIPASIFGLLLLQSRNRQTPPAANRPATPTPAKTPAAN